MFINDLMISLPSYYTLSWPEEVVNNHQRGTAWDDIEIKYYPPRASDDPEMQKFLAKIHRNVKNNIKKYVIAYLTFVNG